MNYKGFTIELNPGDKRGNDYIFYNESGLKGNGRSIANCKNQIDVILSG